MRAAKLLLLIAAATPPASNALSACDCQLSWNYSWEYAGQSVTETYIGCSATGNWNTSWCYVQGGSNCSLGLDSVHAGEERKWRECEECTSMFQWNYDGDMDGVAEAYYGCNATADWNTTWCYVQGGPNCAGHQDSIHAGEERKWRECGDLTPTRVTADVSVSGDSGDENQIVSDMRNTLASHFSVGGSVITIDSSFSPARRLDAGRRLAAGTWKLTYTIETTADKADEITHMIANEAELRSALEAAGFTVTAMTTKATVEVMGPASVTESPVSRAIFPAVTSAVWGVIGVLLSSIV
jgi:hypothetical protein